MVRKSLTLINLAIHNLKPLAGAHIRNRYWAKARDILVQVCEADETDIKSQAGLMHTYLQLGDFPQARTYDIMLNVGGACAAEGKFDLAEQYCRRAIRVNPRFPGSYYSLGNALKSQRRFGEAVDANLEALRLDPKYAEATLNLGVSFKELGQYGNAVSTYLDTLRINPRSLKALHNLGSAYASLTVPL